MASPSQTSQTHTISFNTDFCLQLSYKVLQKQIQKGFSNNFMSSPLSLHIILSLVAAGSKGQTLEQLLYFLGSQSKDHLNSVSSQLVSGLRHVEGTDETGGPILSFANGAWVEKTFGLKTSFEEIVKNGYRSQIELVDFINKAEEVVGEVNSWVENTTNGLIKQILPPHSLNRSTMLVLANALYFKGAWDQKFNPMLTRTRSFNLLNGENVEVPYMTSKTHKRYYYKSFEHNFNSFESFKVLSLPYRSGSNYPVKFSMHFFLSHGKHGLPNLIRTLNSNPSCLNQEFERSYEGLDEIWIPKFKFSFDLDAQDDMKELGLTLPFTPGELTEVSDSSNSHKLYVSKILQKAFVEVNEEGTEAAAATVTGMSYSCGARRHQASFVADHPFLFMIREETSMAVFFIGAVLNPLLDS